VAEAEAAEREAAYQASKREGSTLPSSNALAMADHGADIYAKQKATGKFVRSNAFITELTKPRTDVGCPEATDGHSYLTAPAITSQSYAGGGKLTAQALDSFKKREDGLDYQGSKVWGHGKVGALPQTYGT
jgi:hypothetical protein